jgi:hypothetical protein
MDGWTKLHERTAESVDLAELLDEEPEAFALFMLMLAKAGVWGRFPAHPKLLRARVAPMSERLNAKRIGELLPLLIQRRLVTAYEGDGMPLLYTTKHFTYNAKQAWHRVGRPEFPPPSGFVLPDSLVAYISDVEAGKYRNKTVETERKKLRLDENQSQTTPQEYSVGVVTVNATEQTLDVRRETLDVRNDVETNESTPIAPSGVGLKAKKEHRDAERLRKQTEALDAALESLTPVDRALLDRMIAGQQLNPKRNGKPLTLLQQATQASIYAKELAEHGPECWRACCEIACEKEVYTAEYARGCTKNWTPGRGKRTGLWRDAGGGVIETEAEMDAYQIGSIRRAIAAGTWDEAVGIDRLSERHPDYGKRVPA